MKDMTRRRYYVEAMLDFNVKFTAFSKISVSLTDLSNILKTNRLCCAELLM